MGVLQRFERRLETLVEGAFAKAFRSGVQPVEIAGALQRETTDRAVIVGQGRTLVPNQFVVELGFADHERLEPYGDTLGEEFARMLTEYGAEEHYTFVGPVRVRFEEADDIDTGRYRIRSDVVRGAIPAPSMAHIPTQGNPVLVLAPGSPEETSYPLAARSTVLGRADDCDLRVVDPGASRRHAEVRRVDDHLVTVVDLGSTNGTLVNGERAGQADLRDGDTITIGETTFTFRSSEGKG
ncbi:MAG: FhaA domain-containing protein [Actinomycetes bacterium]